jgi:hypothetical protein
MRRFGHPQAIHLAAVMALSLRHTLAKIADLVAKFAKI